VLKTDSIINKASDVLIFKNYKQKEFKFIEESFLQEPQPFLKWAGGKSNLLTKIEKYFPNKIDRYFEPFLGGGAVFFHLKYRFPRMQAFLSDSNADLINCYRIVRDRPEELMFLLDEHLYNFNKDREKYYYEVRKQNSLPDELERAARMIFLNKTCFNGLWRVNAKGEFNVPIGSQNSLKLYNCKNILATSNALKNTNLNVRPFEEILAEVKSNDFVYLDPPYFPISTYSDFKRYTSEQFRESNHEDLAVIFKSLDQLGCNLVLSNSDNPKIRQLFFEYNITSVLAPRFINCKGNLRGNISELIITNIHNKKNQKSLISIAKESKFPITKYMGSKQRLIPFIMQHISELKFKSAVDAFSGSGCVSYALKKSGVQVFSNDFLKFCYHIAHASIENNSIILSNEDIIFLQKKNNSALTFIQDTYNNIFYDFEDCKFLDNFWANLNQIKSPYKRSLALAAIVRACMKKRPRGLFTFTGQKGWDERLDLKIPLQEQFIIAAHAFNNAVFSNKQKNKTFNLDVFDLDSNLAELVYIDTPYISPYSDCDYTRRYHFVEGYCTYWKGVEIIPSTMTKKFRSYETAFSKKDNTIEAFQRLFNHFRKSIIVLSYSSNGIPTREQLIELLRDFKKHVSVYEIQHRYHHGNQAHKVDDNKSNALEYLFIAK
jgi:DNA adenine methylase